ncbi:hypothetical protein TNCV_1484081 [Trichonephila clavipes]|nr:hypothetical protein TNCV_1484081 [Trichonephila clavipes]
MFQKKEDPVTLRQKGTGNNSNTLPQDNFAIAYTDGSSDRSLSNGGAGIILLLPDASPKKLETSNISAPPITLDDANAVAKHRIMNHTFKKPLVTEFDCPRIITSTIARLRTEHLKGMKIHPDKTRSYVQCKHCPDLQLTPNHILNAQPSQQSY